MKRERSALLERNMFDLSSTEWAEWPNAEVMNAIVFAARGCVNSYPDRGATRIRELLAGRHSVEPEQIVLGNGAGDLLQTAALALLSRGDELLTPWPSYSLYPLMARRAGARAAPVPLRDGHIDPEALLAAVGERTRGLVLCNPNDPSGTYLDSRSLAGLISRLPEHVHVLLDEALVHFQNREHEDACLRLVARFPRLLVFRSFSNAYGLSGLRAGYVVGSPEAAPLLDALAPVLGVNSLSQAAVEYALSRGDAELAVRREMVIEQRRRLADALAGLPLDGPASQAHFVWMRARGLNGGRLATALERGGVLVFPGSVLGDADHVRVSLKGPPAIDRLLAVLPGIAAFRAEKSPSAGALRASGQAA